MNPADLKRQLRRWGLAMRDALGPERRARASRDAAEHLLAHPAGRIDAKTAAFSAIRSEADPAALFLRPHLAFPRVGPAGLELYWCRPEDTVPCPPYGIREPTAIAPPVRLEELDLVVVPGLVFDAHGHRIGYGKGYYDRLLEQIRAVQPLVRCVGFAFEAQVVDRVPHQPFDQPLDGLATEAGLRWFSVEGDNPDR